MTLQAGQKVGSQFRKFLAPVFAIFILSLAAWLLYHELEHYRWQDIRQSLQSIPLLKVILCLVLTAFNYSVLFFYDQLALIAIRHPLPFRKVAFASFTGFVASYNFGATLGGVPVRYRVYSAAGLSAVEILRLTIILGVTFWIGEIALAGLSFVIAPFNIPAQLHLPFTSVYGLGWVLIAIASGYVLLTVFIRKPIRIWSMDVHLPGPGLTMAQIGVAVADLLVACGCLYVLMPDDLGMNYPQFLGVYLLAVVAVILTHVPGGIGVFELVILTLCGASAKGDVVAALLVYRVIYYLLPLFIAIVLLGKKEYSSHRHRVDPVFKQAGRMAAAITPTLLSMAALISGLVLLISGTVPTQLSRVGLIEKYSSLPLMEASHFIGSLTGVALLLVARGLRRKLDSAWWSAMLLLSIGILASLLKGFDYEEAILLSIVLVALFFCRKRFYRKGSLIHERFSIGWITTVALAVLCSLWLGFFVYKHVEYQNYLWWDFAIHGDAPRFLRACVGVVGVLLIFTFWKLISPAEGPRSENVSQEQLDAAERIVAQSSRTAANLALLGDKRFLFNTEQTAFLMYAVENRSWVVMGDPVGPEEEWSELIWKFRELCDLYDGWPVFYQVDPESLSVYLDQGFTLLKLGEEGRVSAKNFTLEGSHFKSLRSNRNKAQKIGCTFEVIPREQVPEILPRLKEISDSWMNEKNAAEKGFSLGFFDESYLKRYPCAVIKLENKIIAFSNLWLTADKDECSVDLMRYDSTGPHGLMDYLFVELLFWSKEAGYEWFSMGMAPLAGIENHPLAPLWNKTAGLIYRHGDHFYRFEGLREYKDKFDPEWKSKYLASPGGLSLPQILADVTRLIGREKS